MIKQKAMKKIFTLFVIATILFGCSEEYDDSGLRNDLNDLVNRVEKLEELCKQMNTNISSLQSIVTALQSNDYITSVSPAVENGRISVMLFLSPKTILLPFIMEVKGQMAQRLKSELNKTEVSITGH